MFISTCASQIYSKITLVSDYFKDKWREHGTKLTPNMVFRYRNRDWSYYWYSTDKNSYICLFFYVVCGGERVQTGCDVAPRSTKMKQEVLPRKEIATKTRTGPRVPPTSGKKWDREEHRGTMKLVDCLLPHCRIPPLSSYKPMTIFDSSFHEVARIKV